MQFVKFSLLSIFLISSLSAKDKFTSKECLNANFDAMVKAQKKYFGLINEEFSIKKNGCLVEVVYKNMLTTKWIVDVCREPLHIKIETKSGLSVLKKTDKECGAMENDFCFHSEELKKYLQDQGLVFAEGEKENLQDAHGQVYCSYLLLQRYLDDDVIFSKYSDSLDVFEPKKENCELPNNKIESKVETLKMQEAVDLDEPASKMLSTEEKRKF